MLLLYYGLFAAQSMQLFVYLRTVFYYLSGGDHFLAPLRGSYTLFPDVMQNLLLLRFWLLLEVDAYSSVIIESYGFLGLK